MFYAGEGLADLIHSRIPAWCAEHGVLEDNLAMAVTEDAPAMNDASAVDGFIRMVDNFDPLTWPALFIFDTYARLMAEAGLSENDPSDVMALVKGVKRLQQRGAAAVLIHHSGKDTSRGARGSNSLLAAVDAAWEVQAHWHGKGGHAIRVSCAKMKMAEKPTEPLYYAARPAHGALVLDRADADVWDDDKKTGGAPARTQRLDNGLVGEVLATDKAKDWSEYGLAGELHERNPELGSLATIRNKLRALREMHGRTAFYVGEINKSHAWKWRDIGAG